MRRQLALAQGAYYLASGLWPLVSMRTFELVTGPKVDRWLVRMVGLLAATIGGVLTVRAARPTPSHAPDALLAGGSALAFAAVDVVYVARGRISRAYLADAVVELVLAGGWVLVSRERPRPPGSRPPSEGPAGLP